MANKFHNSSIKAFAKSTHMSQRSISDCIQSFDNKLNRTQLLLPIYREESSVT